MIYNQNARATLPAFLAGFAIVSAVIAMARALDLEVIAEGVETEAQRTLLAGLGCDAYQGYLFSAAIPIKEFNALLVSHYDAPVASGSRD